MKKYGPGFAVTMVCAGVAIIIVLAIAHVRYWASTSRLPDSGASTVRLPGLRGDVEIRIDASGIPHIAAEYELDLWYAQGYVHARERFFEMDLARRRATGRLSEIFGEVTLLEDRKMRTLRIGNAVLKHKSQLDAKELEVLNAYANGVNAAIERNGRWISPESWSIGLDPAPWRIDDSIAVALLYHLELSVSMSREFDRSVEFSRLGREEAVRLWGWSNREARNWIPPIDQPSTPRHPDDFVTEGLSERGSCAWVIDSSRTTSGRAVLTVATHDDMRIPARWYGIHLTGPETNVAGASIPGLPAVANGHTATVAWGLTPSMLDDQDLYALVLDESRSREEIDGSWQPLRTVTEVISVRWRDQPELLKVRISERGPVIRDGESVLALNWTGTRGPSMIRAFLNMSRSHSVADVVGSWKGVTGPSFNLLAADVEGHILHQVVGLIPDRGRGAGRLISPGNDSRWNWRGLLPMDANPHKVDPDEGYLAMAGQDIFSEGDFARRNRFPGEFNSPWRVRRIRALLEGQGQWTVERCLEVLGDVKSTRAIAMLKQLWPDLDQHGGATASSLQRWDGRLESGSEGAYVYAQLIKTLTREISSDEALREGLRDDLLDADGLLRLLAGGGDETWWDDLRTPEKEDRAAIVTRCLDEIDAGRSSKTWGEAHQASFVHPLVRFPAIGTFFEFRASTAEIPAPGDASTINAFHSDPGASFRVVAAPRCRFIADVGNWDDSVLVIAPGQSGRPWSAHYSDQLDEWLHQQPREFPFSPEAVARSTQSRLLLSPQ